MRDGMIVEAALNSGFTLIDSEGSVLQCKTSDLVRMVDGYVKANEELLSAIKAISEALSDAKEHLEYCNYGDSWERECAYEDGLPDKLDEAMTIASKYIPEVKDGHERVECEGLPGVSETVDEAQ